MSGDRTERTLRERGPRERGASLPPLPADVETARSRLRVIDRRRSLRVLAGATLGTIATGAAAVLVAVAITSPSPVTPLATGSDHSATPGTASETPRPSASTAPVVAACAPADLAAQAGAWGAAAGSRGTTVTVTNTSSVTCVLSGAPGARLSTASGTLATVAGQPGNGPALQLAPGDSVITSLVWSNWCDALPANPIAATLILPGGALAVTPDTGRPDVLVPPCMGANDVNHLSTIDFQQP